MAIGADELPFHDWQVVDPASMAYIRHLVESLEHLTFDDACMLQLDGGENASDLFNLHRPVITGVPHDVASALNTLEEILSRGSPTLEAYQREDIRETRVLQEEKVRTTMAEVHYIDGLVDEHMDAVEGTRARLHAAREAATPSSSCSKRSPQRQRTAASHPWSWSSARRRRVRPRCWPSL